MSNNWLRARFKNNFFFYERFDQKGFSVDLFFAQHGKWLFQFDQFTGHCMVSDN